ncbi:beta-ketoacyl-ACP synthase III [Lentzea kentuckyensis]|uniref:beta-ketoacyl-ACP synthase III n=1 Tax=Lentzea kentuckyensis TaxID=360086 RepID=UPI000A37BFBD|nr:beta-ketoacyl-ACP synthase III [Lentzea kentuckyensis]
MGKSAVLRGLGAALPPNRVTNEDLAAQLDTSDEWIQARTGIRQRFVISPGMATSDLAVEAGRRALASADAVEVGAVVLATSTPDHPCPATAPEVAARLGLTHAAAFDVAAVCTGFVYALATASGLISAGIVDSVLVIGADTFSTILDPTDRTTRAIFGDGAGAVVLSAGEADEDGALLGFDLGSDGANRELIMVPAGGSRERASGVLPADTDRYFTMQGKQVFTNAVLRMSESVSTLAKRIGWDDGEIDRVVAHQANIRILRAVGDQLGLEPEQVVANLDRVGNTVAASIPLALADAVASGNVEPGHRVALAGFGGGLTWGATALRWPEITVEEI